MDFWNFTSKEMVIEYSPHGKLVKMLLFPAEFGGEDLSHNIVYVPPGIPDINDQITATLMRFFKEGRINKLDVKPEYTGNSFVPSKIRMKAWHSDKQGSFEPCIDIW